MPADTGATIRPLQHLASCDQEVYGRAVLSLMQGPAAGVTPEAVRLHVHGYRSTAKCGCLAWRTRAVQADLRRARLAWEHSTTDANADRVQVVESELQRLRGMA